MYKCTDCGQEYEIKPDYCDCGNDRFDEIVPQQVSQDVNFNVDIEKNNVLPKLNATFEKTAENKVSTHRFNVDVPSLLIFLFCIILSILSVIYIGKDSLDNMEKNRVNSKKNNVNLVKNTNIPSINKMWNDSINTVTTNKVETPIKNISATKVNKTVTTNIPKINTINKTVKIKKQVKANTPITQNRVSTKSKTTTNAASVKQKPAKSIKTIATTPKQTQIVNKTDPINQAQLQQEVANYKIGLRNKLANSISFEKIVGDGNCSVAFKIDTAGNLINRRFSVQSDNDSLNNAVYSAIMNNPTYKSPPTGYKSETLIFSVKMYGGRFSVTLN